MTALVLMVAVAFSATACSSGGHSYGDYNKQVPAKNVSFTISFTLEELADTKLITLVEFLPPEYQEYLASLYLEELADTKLITLVEFLPPEYQEYLASLDPSTRVDLAVDGKLWMSMTEKHRCSATSICINAVWQGTIGINISGFPEIVLDTKMAQLQLSATIPDDAPEALDLKANLHVHGKVIIGGDSGEVVDIRHQAVLCVDDGEITKQEIGPCHHYHHCHTYHKNHYHSYHNYHHGSKSCR